MLHSYLLGPECVPTLVFPELDSSLSYDGIGGLDFSQSSHLCEPLRCPTLHLPLNSFGSDTYLRSESPTAAERAPSWEDQMNFHPGDLVKKLEEPCWRICRPRLFLPGCIYKDFA